MIEEKTSTPRRAFYPSIEGLRGIAAIIVVANHVGVYTGQIGAQLFGQPGSGLFGSVLNRFEVGLPVFFGISGFLLFSPYATATLAGLRMPRTGPYFWHRALRIFPGYWVMTIAALVLLNREQIHTMWEAVRPFLVLQVYQHDALPVGMGQSWSLCVEIGFYLLLPFFSLGLHRFATAVADPGHRMRRMLIPIAVVALIGIVFTAYEHRPAAGAYPLYYLWLPGYLAFFAAGMALAVLAARKAQEPETDVAPARRPVPIGIYWGAALVCFIVVCSPLTGPSTVDYPSLGDAVVIHLIYIAAVLLLMWPLVRSRTEPRLATASLSRPAVLFLGRISYGIFLWHVVILDGYYTWTGRTLGTGNYWLLLVLTVLATLTLAAASYYLIEHPAMRLRKVVSQRAVLPVPAAPVSNVPD